MKNLPAKAIPHYRDLPKGRVDAILLIDPRPLLLPPLPQFVLALARLALPGSSQEPWRLPSPIAAQMPKGLFVDLTKLANRRLDLVWTAFVVCIVRWGL